MASVPGPDLVLGLVLSGAHTENKPFRGEQGPGQGLQPPATPVFLSALPNPCVYITMPIITDTYVNLLILYLQHYVYVWGVVNVAGEIKSSSFLLVVSKEIYGKPFV